MSELNYQLTDWVKDKEEIRFAAEQLGMKPFKVETNEDGWFAIYTNMPTNYVKSECSELYKKPKS